MVVDAKMEEARKITGYGLQTIREGMELYPTDKPLLAGLYMLSKQHAVAVKGDRDKRDRAWALDMWETLLLRTLRMESTMSKDSSDKSNMVEVVLEGINALESRIPHGLPARVGDEIQRHTLAEREGHLRWMLQECRELVTHDPVLAAQWLAFVRGVLWVDTAMSLQELAETLKG